jgi:hypothetical protein
MKLDLFLRVLNPETFDASPEMGMGYHMATLRQESPGSGHNAGVLYCVLNGSIAVNVTALGEHSRVGRLVTDSDDLQAFEFDVEDDVEKLELACVIGPVAISRMKEMGHVHGSPPFSKLTTARQKFVRYSAYRNDRRVTALGGLLAGSFATPLSDAKMVPNGLAAVGRYALPNPSPVTWRFDITSPSRIAMKYGTVLPAFGQAGGGAEVEFTIGLPDGSVGGPNSVNVL